MKVARSWRGSVRDWSWAHAASRSLTPTTALALVYMASHVDGRLQFWMPADRLARATGLSLSAARRALRDLADAGLIVIVPKHERHPSAESSRARVWRLATEQGVQSEHPLPVQNEHPQPDCTSYSSNANSERESRAWELTRERLRGGALAHPQRADTIQRAVLAELERGTPERRVRAALARLDAITARALRITVVRVATEEQDRARQDEMAHASRERRPADAAMFERICGLVDSDPDEAARLLRDPATPLAWDERTMLTDEVNRALALRGER